MILSKQTENDYLLNSVKFNMDEAELERRRVNQRNYRARNPDKVRKRNKKYREMNRSELMKISRQYYAVNKEGLVKRKRDYVQANSEKVAACNKAARTKARTAALTVYGGPSPECGCCSENDSDSLCIDHVNGGGNAHRKQIGRLAGYSFYVWLKKNGYPSGFRVLCLNCNDAMGIFGYCPHQGRPEKPRTAMSAYFQRTKERVLSHYSDGDCRCAKCGVSDLEFLCLDHNGVEHRRNGKRGGWSTYKWAIDNDFPKGFQVLCFRCNFLKWKGSI